MGHDVSVWVHTQKSIQKNLQRNSNNSGYTNSNLLNKTRIIYYLYTNKEITITKELLISMENDLFTPNGLKNGILGNYCNIISYIILNKLQTQKGVLVRMGSGKGNNKTISQYLPKNSLCFKIIETDSMNKANIALDIFVSKYPFIKLKQNI